MKGTSKTSIMLALCLAVSLFAGCLTGFAATPEVIQVDKYADVGEGHWAYPWVTYMTGEGYIHGYPTDENDGLEVYKPEQLITRAEFVTILYFMLAPHGSMSQSFSDLDVDDWYYEYISKAVATGYLSGYGDGTVKPNAYITREEASSIVYRAFKIEKYVNATDFADEADISSWAYEAVMSLAELGVVVGYTGEAEDASRIQPKVNITRAEVASLLANADKFYPAQVILSEQGAVVYPVAAGQGGTLSFDMFPKNVSDNLTVSISVEPETVYTVTYTKGGSSVTVTPEEFAQVVFTADELKNANVVVNFPNAKDGDSVTVDVVVTDNAIEGDDKVVGGETYTATFDEASTPTPTPTPTPNVAPIGPGSNGGQTTYYTVSYVGPDGEDLGSERVKSGSTVKNLPKYEGDDVEEGYTWYTDEARTQVFNPATAIRQNCTLYAKVEKRDRVVEALQGYQAMKGQETAATTNVLSGDAVDATLTGAYDSDAKTWWTNDMLSVIVTNDRNKLEDGDGYDDVVADKELKSTYEDVARYVVDNSDVFAEAAIDSSSKFEYVWYFRAMIKTIDAAANDAIKAYKDARADGVTTKDQAYANFQEAAVNAVNSSIEQAIADGSVPESMKSDLKVMALGYVAKVLTNAGGLTTLKEELGALEVDAITVEKLAEMLAANAIYPVN